jgi:membrane protein YdbS with pleckstrin-like domain
MPKLFNLDKHLDSDEKIIRFFRPSRKAYILQYIFWILLFLIAIYLDIISATKADTNLFILWKFIEYICWLAIIISIIMLIRLEYRIFSRRYALTNERIMYSNGIFSEIFKSAQYNYISDIEFEQSFWDKIMNTGTLKIHTVGTDEYQIRYRKVSEPLDIKKTINDIQGAHLPKRRKR